MQNAKVGGMEADLKLSSSEYSLVLSIFFVVSENKRVRRRSELLSGVLVVRASCSYGPCENQATNFLAVHNDRLGKHLDILVICLTCI